MTDFEVLLKQYERLISLVEFHHKRWDGHWKVYLAILAILVAGFTASLELEETSIIKCLISILGIIISFSGYISLNRISYDTSLAYLHLRDIEAQILNQKANFLPVYSIGFDFFNTGSYKNLQFWPPFFLKASVKRLAYFSFILFGAFFVFGLFV